MDPQSKDILDHVSDSWPIISGLAVTMLGGVRLFMHRRKEQHNRAHQIHARLSDLEDRAGEAVTHDELDFCKHDLSTCIDKMGKDIRQTNSAEHKSIREQLDRVTNRITDRLIAHIDRERSGK